MVMFYFQMSFPEAFRSCFSFAPAGSHAPDLHLMDLRSGLIQKTLEGAKVGESDSGYAHMVMMVG